MDNTTLLFNSIQRTYRNAIVDFIRTRMSEEFGVDGIEQIKTSFSKKNPETGKTQWEDVKKAAEERRAGGTGELSTPIRDEFELLGVEHFFSVFEKHFDILCPNHATKPKKEKNQARIVLTGWMKQIKNVRDPLSHPVTDDIDYDDSVSVLYCARKTLDFCGLPEASTQIINLQKSLLGGYSGQNEKIFVELPPPDEVVLNFVGRHRELAELNNWFTNNISKRWALSGEGGKGKSAIAFAFAKMIASRTDHEFDAVLWLSAKRRRFIEGKAILVDRPDFFDKRSAAEAIISFYGIRPFDEEDEIEQFALSLLSDFPSLLIVDDIDTVFGDGEDAVEFLLMTVPERTKSKVLLTSRRSIVGMGKSTTQIQGLSTSDGEAFIRSRCDLMGISQKNILAVKSKLLEVTDSSPLYVEDLLRLVQSGLSIEKAIGLWAEKRGTEARKYAIQREYDQLDQDAKQVLLALSLHGSCQTQDICRALNWTKYRLLDAMEQLRMMFLLPIIDNSKGKHLLALNNNIRSLVLDVFRESDALRRVERLMKAATGELRTKLTEDREVKACIRRARICANRYRIDEAISALQEVQEKYVGRSDIYAALAWVFKKNNDVSDARIHFERAHELDCKDRDCYWHWSKLEASQDEWRASARAAELGVEKFGNEQGLLFRIGYALHREGKELINDGDSVEGVKICNSAQKNLDKALSLRTSEERNYMLRKQIFRAITLNLEALNDGEKLARILAKWQSEYFNDAYSVSEYERLRLKFPQFLRKH